MFKILMCNCNRYRLDQLEVPDTYSFTFDNCRCSSDHEIFALICEQNCSAYNLTSFARTYFPQSALALQTLIKTQFVFIVGG